jgi:MFS family permease
MNRLPRSYARLFAASAVSNLGDGVAASAGPLLALSLTRDARLIALVTFAATLPWLVLSLPAGVWLDRWDRRAAMVRANLGRCAAFALVAVTTWTDTLTIPLLLAITLAIGACEVVFDMAAQAFLPAVVPPDLLERANGRLYAAEIVTNSFLGLPLGAWLFAALAAAPFGVNALALLAAGLLLAGVRTLADDTPAPRTSDAPVASPRRFSRELREGMAWLWRHRLLRTLALMLGVANACHTLGASVFVKYAAEALGLGPRGFGLLLSAMALGAVAGGLLGERVARRLGAGPAMVVAYAVFAVADAVPGLVQHVVAVTISGVVMSVAGTTWNVVTVSLRQRLIPGPLFGRVNSVYRFLGTGTTAVGAIAGGLVAHRFGLRATYLVSAVTIAAALAAGARTLARGSDYIAPERTPAPPSIT